MKECGIPEILSVRIRVGDHVISVREPIHQIFIDLCLLNHP